MHYDVIVIGGGHAGAEAATLASRAGARTLLLTQDLQTIGQMSCNPAIGGIAKGTVVREVAALGGVMARATDMARIQFRMLNRSKGPAVWSPRAQCDRALYRRAVRQLLEAQPNLRCAEGTASSFLVRQGHVTGVVTKAGLRLGAKAVVLTAGTFLRGAIHRGLDPQIPAGRAGEPPSLEISEAIVAHGITRERFKTGTPPRIEGRTADLGQLTRQDGDGSPYWFNHFDRVRHPDQLPCYLAWAGAEVKEIILRHLKESALYGGAISGKGPRYCPSVEDKVVRFPHAVRHQVFLEPEGLGTSEMYVNGLSTSLPAHVQLAFLRAVPGLAQVEMTRPGYAIEYDFFPPTQLYPTLESRAIRGLFFAGQVNGTTGYEEAAGQGAIAGLNAALLTRGGEQVVLSRDQAMVGVLVDDLVHRGVDEPYRLFTSRAEFRILLRQDNALRRLYPLARRLGLLTEKEIRVTELRLEAEDVASQAAGESVISPAMANPILAAAGESGIQGPTCLRDLCRRPGVTLASLLAAVGSDLQPEHANWADVEIKYEGYLAKERAAAMRLADLENMDLPPGLEYHSILTLSWEAREKLGAVQPSTIGQAGRVPGVSPADLQNLAFAILRQRA